jgi:pimeloyl-ACP methyl ester carboxylesterase
VRLRGLRFHYLERGAAGAAPLLLLHGGAQTAHSFDEVAPALARDRHVVCLDLRGHGRSDWAPSYRRDELVADVGALLAHLGWRQPALLGMSLGGLTAMAFAARHPAVVRALVVVDIAPTVSADARSAIAQQLSIREWDSFEDAVAQAHAFNPRRSLENLRDRLRHALRELPDGRWAYAFDPGIGAGAEDLDRLWTEIRRIACPTLLVRGAESPAVSPEAAERFLRDVRRSTLVTVAGAGHSIMGDNPAGFLAAVRPFLRRVGA